MSSKLVRFVLYKIRAVEERFRGELLAVYIRALGGTCGANLRAGRRCTFKHPPHSGFFFGENVILGNDIVFDIEPRGKINIGPGVKLTGYSFIAASGEIRIGGNSQIAEYVSIRDSGHGMQVGELIGNQNLDIGTVVVGRDVWIGRGAIVLKGAVIEDGAVIGANSVVRHLIPGNAIAVGSPAKVVRWRR